MNRNTKSLLILLGILFILGVLAIGVIVVPMVIKEKEVSRARQISQMIMTYCYDHGGKLSGEGWQRDIMPYNSGLPLDGFALNEAVAGKRVENLTGDVVLLFEAPSGVDIGGLSDLPLEPRFGDTFICAFLDLSTQSVRDPKTLNWSPASP